MKIKYHRLLISSTAGIVGMLGLYMLLVNFKALWIPSIILIMVSIIGLDIALKI